MLEEPWEALLEEALEVVAQVELLEAVLAEQLVGQLEDQLE